MSADVRIANVTGVDHCSWCCDDGMLPVSWRGGEHGIEEYGPCPACEKGHALEFGPHGIKMWPRGYWQGRPFGQSVLKQCRCNAPLAKAEEAQQWTQMVREMEEALTIDRRPAPVSSALSETTDESAAPAPPDPPEPDPEPGPPPPPEGPSHFCPQWKGGQTVPWSQEECATCGPPEPKEEIPTL